MEAIRHIQTVENGEIHLQLPQQFWGQEVEIIVLPAPQQIPQPIPFDPRQFFGVAQQSKQTIDDYLVSSREGWL